VHEFCLACITSWASINNTCPLCKRHFNSILDSSGTLIAIPDRAQHDSLGDAESMSYLCQVCNNDHDETRLLVCDGCDHCYHLYCLEPTLDAVPEGDWFCPNCTEDVDADHDEELHAPQSDDSFVSLSEDDEKIKPKPWLKQNHQSSRDHRRAPHSSARARTHLSGFDDETDASEAPHGSSSHSLSDSRRSLEVFFVI
jgi:hypothetical protein